MDYKEYIFNSDKRVPLEDLNLPIEVRDYITNLCEVTEVAYEIYPKELLDKGIIVSVWDGVNSQYDNIESRWFNLYETTQYTVFEMSGTFFDKVEDGSPGYMVYQYKGDNSVIVIKV